MSYVFHHAPRVGYGEWGDMVFGKVDFPGPHDDGYVGPGGAMEQWGWMRPEVNAEAAASPLTKKAAVKKKAAPGPPRMKVPRQSLMSGPQTSQARKVRCPIHSIPDRRSLLAGKVGCPRRVTHREQGST